jgi:hypothetical protein
MSRTCSWNCLSMPLLVIFPMSAPIPAPSAMPKTGMKNSNPKSRPQNIPQVAPAPTAWWFVVTWYLPSASRRITAIASGWMIRSLASRSASSAAAVAVVSSGYPIAISVAICGLPFPGPVSAVRRSHRRSGLPLHGTPRRTVLPHPGWMSAGHPAK